MKRLHIEYRLALILGITVSLLGTLLWLNGDTYMGDGYLYGDGVYKLGWPATEVIFAYAWHHWPLTKADDRWAIPAMDALVMLQMFCWAYIARLARRLVIAVTTGKKA